MESNITNEICTIAYCVLYLQLEINYRFLVKKTMESLILEVATLVHEILILVQHTPVLVACYNVSYLSEAVQCPPEWREYI